MKRIFEYLHEHAGMLKRFFLVLLVIAVVLDFFVHREEVHFFGDRISGFWSLFGILGCLAMIVLCKLLSSVWLKKGEDYYDD